MQQTNEHDQHHFPETHMSANAAIKTRAWDAIQAAVPDLEALALQILAHPETGYAEERASRWLGAFLEGHGFSVTQPFGGLDTAFSARRRGEAPGPVIAFLAEYDALPEVGHGCGHNLIGPMAAGAALGLAAALDSLGGEVRVIGTPAEEYLGQVEGKVRLLEAGAFEGVDVALMAHPFYDSQVLESDLGFIACDLVFRGRPAHAAADPWNGRNALDGLLATFTNLGLLRQQLAPEIRIHGVITDGGQAPNVIPARAAASFMVRAPRPDALEDAYARFEACARAGALAAGVELEVQRITTVYNTRVNPTLNRLVAQNFAQLGQPFNPAGYRMSASSDFGNLSQALPACMFVVASHPAGIPWHTPQVAEASGERRALEAMRAAACVLAGVAVDLLADASLMAAVRSDFEVENQ